MRPSGEEQGSKLDGNEAPSPARLSPSTLHASAKAIPTAGQSVSVSAEIKGNGEISAEASAEAPDVTAHQLAPMIHAMPRRPPTMFVDAVPPAPIPIPDKAAIYTSAPNQEGSTNHTPPAPVGPPNPARNCRSPRPRRRQ